MSNLPLRYNLTYEDAEFSFSGWQNPIQPCGTEDPGEGYDLLEGVQPKAVQSPAIPVSLYALIY